MNCPIWQHPCDIDDVPVPAPTTPFPTEEVHRKPTEDEETARAATATAVKFLRG